MLRRAFHVAVPLAMLVAGCAQRPASAPVVSYRCDGGRAFTVLDGGAAGGATLDIHGMRFRLHTDASDASGERMACSQLTLWRRGTSARVDIHGDVYENCRAQQ